MICWTNLPNPQIPVLFCPSTGEDIWKEDSGSWFNPSEITITIKLIKNLLDKANTPDTVVNQNEIAVIAPFREHVVRVRKTLRQLNWNTVSVGAVENYQGDEWRIVILNCV